MFAAIQAVGGGADCMCAGMAARLGRSDSVEASCNEGGWLGMGAYGGSGSGKRLPQQPSPVSVLAESLLVPKRGEVGCARGGIDTCGYI